MAVPLERKRGRRLRPGHLGMSTGALRAVVLLAAAMFALSAVTWYHGNTQAAHLAATQRTQRETVRTLNRTVRKLEREVKSSCRFDGDLAGVPITLNPATRRASELGVKIVSDSRVAWRLAGCPGRLASPAPSFLRWARFYRLPVK